MLTLPIDKFNNQIVVILHRNQETITSKIQRQWEHL